MASGPRLLLLDEPFNGLDQENRDALIDTLQRLKTDGVAVLALWRAFSHPDQHALVVSASESARCSCSGGLSYWIGPVPAVAGLSSGATFGVSLRGRVRGGRRRASRADRRALTRAGQSASMAGFASGSSLACRPDSPVTTSSGGAAPR